MLQIFTIGYEGRELGSFLTELQKHKIECLVDVRDWPYSRKKGFSKTSLAEACNSVGIDYFHFQQAGNPLVIRKRFLPNRDYKGALDAYEKHLNRLTNVVAELYNMSLARSICLMCFEKDVQHCHRGILAKKISAYNGAKIKQTNL